MNLKVKIIAGFRKDQEYSIDADEAHKAYFLFLHPEARGIFSNGHAMIGSDIKEIVPDYNGTMGWNPTHVLDTDDWNEIRELGVERRIRNLMAIGKEVATLGNPADISTPLRQLVTTKYPQLMQKNEAKRSGGTASISQLLDKNTLRSQEAEIDQNTQR